MALSNKARYNFDSDMRRWAAWRGAGDVLNVADPYEIRDFVIHCAMIGFERGSLKPASIAHLLSSLASLHVRVLEAPDPIKDVIVKGEIRRLRREFGTVQDQAVALRADHCVPLTASSPAHHLQIPIPSITKIRAVCDVTTARGLRDRILLGLGEDLGRRRFRVGLAQDGVAANAEARELCDKGGWDDERRPLSYARNLQPQQGAVARLRHLVPLK